jgi:hypothetical protein
MLEFDLSLECSTIEDPQNPAQARAMARGKVVGAR